jgi:hypothetical protein
VEKFGVGENTEITEEKGKESDDLGIKELRIN